MRPSDSSHEAALQRAFAALDLGDGEALREELSSWAAAGLEEPLAAVLWVHVELLRGELKAAAERLELASTVVDKDEVELHAVSGEVALSTWQPRAAIDHFRRALELEDRADLWLRQALAHDLSDSPERAADCLDRARALDPEQLGGVQHHSPDRFEQAVADAAERLPDTFRAWFERLTVVIDPVPQRELARGREAQTPPDLLGLFIGASALEDSTEEQPQAPAVIFLFQRNLERLCRDEDELAQQVAITLYHELGHALGFDEAGVDRMGLA